MKKECECGNKDDFRYVTVDMIDNIETEKEKICNSCNTLVDYWAYGNWESNTKTVINEPNKQINWLK